MRTDHAARPGVHVLMTDRLMLSPCDPERVRKLTEGPAAFEAAYGLRLADGWLEFPEALPWMLSAAERFGGTPDAEWNLLRLCVLDEERLVIGGCGYKGAPDADGVVEIGYGIAREYRGQGYASECARTLTVFALADPRVRAVVAHTLPQESPSGSVLRKCGYRFDGEAQDPDDGLVWRWRTGIVGRGTPPC